MQNKKLISLIKELNEVLLNKYSDYKGLYLYGSQAKGTANEQSDIDIVALFNEVNFEKEFELSGIICDLMYKYSIYIDMHSYTSETLEQNPYYYDEVVNKGIYYEAA